MEDTPYPKRPTSLPLILSVEEVARLIEAADTPYHRTLLMTAYGTGARRAEIVNLQIADIDKSMMRIHIREGKGGKDREVPLSPSLYEELRQHYRRLARKPTLWLFPGGTCHTSDEPLASKVVWYACRIAALGQAFTNPYTRIHCGTVSPLTCSMPERTSAPFRSCSGIVISKRQSGTSTSPTDI